MFNKLWEAEATENQALKKIKNENLNIICDYMRKVRKATLPEIAENTGFSFPTVKKLVTLGISHNVFFPCDERSVSEKAGRRAQIYQINSDYFHTATIVIDIDTIFTKVYDFCLDTVYSSEREIFDSSSLEIIDEETDKIFTDFPKLKFLTLVLPAPVFKGKIRKNFRLPSLEGIDFKDRYSAKTPAIIKVENDMNILALSALRDERVENKNSVIAAFQQGFTGFGSGFVSEGKLLTGFSGYAGEIHNLPIASDISGCEISKEAFAMISSSIVSIYNPEYLFIYAPENFISAEYIEESLRRHIPDYAVPKVFVKQAFISDMFTGAEIYCQKDMELYF